MAKVMISLPDEFLERVDRAARREHRSRSELIREALRRWLDERTAPRPDAWREAISTFKELEDKWIGRWDSTDVIREFRDTRYGKRDRS
jgi:metal-responsive CopG/Arc/MetJ family transcriptional regulator